MKSEPLESPLPEVYNFSPSFKSIRMIFNVKISWAPYFQRFCKTVRAWGLLAPGSQAQVYKLSQRNLLQEY